MISNFTIVRRQMVAVGALILLAKLSMSGPAALAEDAAPAAVTVTNSAATTNDDEADKAWKAVSRATQQPMPPAEWSAKPPTREESTKFYLDTLHKGMELAKDFYTRYPNHPKADTAKRIEYEMVEIASQQFHDTNLAPRLAALEAKRMTDPNVSEDEKFGMRVHPLEALMHGLPDTADELDKELSALQKDFPKRPEVYKIMLMVVSHSEGERAAKWAKAIEDSPVAAEDVKFKARLELRGAALDKLLSGLPATADELDKNVRALPKDFPGHNEVYNMMIYVLSRMDATHAAALAKDISAGDAPDDVKAQLKVVLRATALEKLIDGFPKTSDEFAKGIEQFKKDFPDNPNTYNLMMGAFEKSEGELTKTLGAELLASPIQENAKQLVEQTLKHGEYLGKPVAIQYTALDGRKVDVTEMKGKVVLVDFWGTWCGVCMHELPKVKDIYAKLHGKGFEIVGIDCNDEKSALEKVVKSREIPWPQYFEEGTHENKFAAQYGVHLFPTMWLVDKKGLLRYVNASNDLEDKTNKLLAE